MSKQYLDPDYVKRLQLNVTKNSSKESPSNDLKNGNMLKNAAQKRPNDIKNLQGNRKYIDEYTKCDITKFKSKVTAIEPMKLTLPCVQTITVPNIKMKDTLRSSSVDRVKIGASVLHSKKSQSKIQTQRDCDDIETTLAKITSSQRAICTTIDSLL